MLIRMLSNHSGMFHDREIKITKKEFYKIATRKDVIQKIVPHLSADDREFLTSGITPEEWKEIFGEDEKEGNK